MTFTDLHVATTNHPHHPIATKSPTLLFLQWLNFAYLPNQLWMPLLPHLSLAQLDLLWYDWTAYRNCAIGAQIELPF